MFSSSHRLILSLKRVPFSAPVMSSLLHTRLYVSNNTHVQVEELRMELNRRDQEMLGMAAKMKTLEEQHHDYQRHIAVLKESLSAKEEHQNMLQADVSLL